MKHFLLFILIAFTACNFNNRIPAQLAEATPEEAGFSSDRLQKVDDLINSYIENEWLPGGVFLVARHGKIVYYKNFGFRSTAKNDPYQKDDIFRIASMTKAITTVAVMQLYEQGKLGLNDPVSDFIPALKNSALLDSFNEKDSSFTTAPVVRPITIRHLLTHTSGITYGDFNQGKLKAVYSKFDMLKVGLSHNSWTTEEFINRLATVPLAFQPGEKFMYGLNVDVLGRVVEVVSGKSLAEYFRENIFEPLGMTDTYFYLPDDKKDRLVPVYAQTDDGLSMAQEDGMTLSLDYPKNKDIGHYAGGGGLSSTALDYARFIQALVNNGKYNDISYWAEKPLN